MSAPRSSRERAGSPHSEELPAQPCPACGEPLFGWTVALTAGEPRSPGWVLDRCEACGLGLIRELEAETIMDVCGEGRVAAANRRSWQAGIGGAHWAAIELPARSLYLTPRSLQLLLERRGAVATEMRQPALGRNQVWMWQTLLNAFTFHDGFARELLRGRLTPRKARSLPAFMLDAVVSALLALPIAVIAVPLELLAVAFRRGGLLVARAGPQPGGD